MPHNPRKHNETTQAEAGGSPDGAPAGLSGLVVLEVVSTPGAAFAAALLADFGADVYVCEHPSAGSPLRRLGGGDGRWWQVLARNKRSVAVDAADPACEDAVRRLLDRADLLIVDDGPDADNPWRRLAGAVDTAPLVLDLFATGADDPVGWGWSVQPELTAAVTGMMALTGWADSEPVQPEVPVAEYLAGAYAAIKVLAELRRRKLKGVAPLDVSVALHEAVQRMIEWQMPVAAAMGRAETRNGNSFPMNAGISNMHRTRDGKYIALSAATQAMGVRVLEMVGGDALRDDPRFATVGARASNMNALYALMDAWFAARSQVEALELAEHHGVVAGPIYTVEDILADPQMQARNNVVSLDGRDGPVAMPGIVPRISGLDSRIRSLGPDIGDETREVLKSLK